MRIKKNRREFLQTLTTGVTASMLLPTIGMAQTGSN